MYGNDREICTTEMTVYFPINVHNMEETLQMPLYLTGKHFAKHVCT